jgi:cytochrome P450
VVTSDAATINEILRARPETFRRSERTDAILSELGIKGVFNAEGGAWRSQRKLAVAALAQRNLKPLYPHIETVAHRLKRRWDRAARTGEALDVVDEMKRFTVDVTMLIAFGHDANTVEASGDVIQRHLEVILPKVGQRILATVPIWRYVRLPSDRQLDRARRRCASGSENSWRRGAGVSTPVPTMRTGLRTSWNQWSWRSTSTASRFLTRRSCRTSSQC